MAACVGAAWVIRITIKRHLPVLIVPRRPHGRMPPASQFSMIVASGITRTLHFGQSLDCFGQGNPNFWLRIAAKRLILRVSRRRRRRFGMTPTLRCL
jgi:hypothetical protein